MKHLIILVFSFTVVMCQVHGGVSSPNILFIMSDDHTAQAIGTYATVLKDLNVPDLPVVIGQNGHDGDKKGAYPTDKDGNPNNHAVIRKAQWDAAQVSDFDGTVVCIRTAPFWDMDADAIYYGPGSWKKCRQMASIRR